MRKDRNIVTPNKLLQQIWQKADRTFAFLDLGCGNGRDCIFMGRNGWRVAAVEKSPEEVARLKAYPDFKKLPITLHQEKVEDFIIKEGKYSIIQLFNVLQFIEKYKALEIIAAAKRALRPDGYIIVSGFTVHEPSYSQQAGLCYFAEGELRKLFYYFAIEFYGEAVIDDPGHPGKEEPHQHHVVRMVAHRGENSNRTTI